MDKLNRNYNLTVEKSGGASYDFLALKRPFTMHFDVSQNTLSQVKTSNFRVFNLNEATRASIRQDQYGYGLDASGRFRLVTFAAGYGENLSNLFSGNLMQAWSAREGTNMVTTMVCSNGGVGSVNATTNLTYAAGTSLKQILTDLVQSLKPFGISPGIIGNYTDSLLRGAAYSEDTFSLLSKLTDGGFFVFNGKAYCLKPNEVVLGEIPVISPASGLKDTPIREGTYLYLDMIMEPRLKMGQLINLESFTGAGVNGQWKICSLKHRGVISDSEGGECITSIGLESPNSKLSMVS